MAKFFLTVSQVAALVLPLSGFVLDKKRVQSNLMESDNLTAWGSVFNGDVSLPVTTIGIGFDYCGLDTLGEILGKHEGIIQGDVDVSKQYFSSNGAGTCNKDRASVGATPYQRFVNSCYDGKVAGPGQTNLDITGEYAPFAGDGVVDRLNLIKNETTLRFVAVVCDPRVRAMKSVKRHLRAENKRAGGKHLDEGVLHSLQLQESQGFDGAIAVGEYSMMLDAWLDAFPKESLLIVNENGLKSFETWSRIFNHIGLKVPTNKNLEKWFEGQVVGDRSLHKHANPAVKNRLNDHYDDYDAKLWESLNTQFW